MSEQNNDPPIDPPRRRNFHRGFEFFASPPDAPRVRRSSDVALAVAGGVLVAILAVVRGDGTSVDEAWGAVVEVLPTWLTWCGQAVYVLSIATAGALLAGIALAGRRRLELLRDLVLAAALAVVAAGALTRFVDDRWPAVALTDLDQTRTTFPAFLVTVVIAVQAAARPHLAALFVLAIVVVGVVLVVVVPSWRHWVEAKLRAPMRQIKSALEVLKDPKKLLTAIGGQIGTEILYASGLMLSVLALGGSISLGQALFINIAVSLFAGILPVPGGIGVTEAGLTAGLAAVGVSSSIALPAVIVYRLCSYYLPPIWGWVSLRWLTHHDYL